MPEAFKLIEASYLFITQVGLIQKILTGAPNYILQLAKACRALSGHCNIVHFNDGDHQSVVV
jgi:hypothetical protein